ncbi:hypothetical protein HPB50_021780 [Hyalomma asiaticum]|uniref:Uncharacterized protein n=1 Tax=Hyalomma asiaticum TaxID=266040 RepID=A0ACB7S770_HYAAI|nr:hypothetical protein HPB50_021780 [Hyalomma asiaticum]
MSHPFILIQGSTPRCPRRLISLKNLESNKSRATITFPEAKKAAFFAPRLYRMPLSPFTARGRHSSTDRNRGQAKINARSADISSAAAGEVRTRYVTTHREPLLWSAPLVGIRRPKQQQQRQSPAASSVVSAGSAACSKANAAADYYF